jgi:hypothetical protein
MAAGRKTGGRQAGTPNAATLTLREQVEQAAGGPLPVLLATLGRQAMDKGDHQLAVTAYAKAAAYVYPRLAASDPPAPPTEPIVITFTDDIRPQAPCSSCGHDPEKDIHIHRHVLHGPVPKSLP